MSKLKKCLSKPVSLLVFCLAPLSISQAGWEVSWIERFDGTSVNMDNWTPQIQANYNNEIQCYTDDETSPQANYEVSNGTLKITARRQQINCPGQGLASRPWTSGRLNSKDKAEFLYGRLETRLRFSDLRGGTWPAFWMLENRIAEDPFKGDNDTINWPNPGAGEIDVWEWYGNAGDRYITNFFNTNNCGAEVRYPYPGGSPDVLTYQTYAVEWTADNIKFFMNDNIVAEHDLSNCPQYEEPMFVLLNVAMGGTLGGNIDPTLNTATLEVEYVAHCVASDLNDMQRCNESTPLGLDDDNDGVINNIDLCPNTPANSQVNASGCISFSEPQTAAPTPLTIAAEDVISIFSDEYQNINGVNLNPDWNQATEVSVVQIEGDNVLKYSGLNYQGTDFIDNKQDLTTMENLHFDYWVENETVLRIFLISPGPEEIAFEFTANPQQWQSMVVPMSTFESVVDLSQVQQIKIEGNGTVFFDNIFFAAPPTPPGPPVVEPPPVVNPPESSGGGSLSAMLLAGVLGLLGVRRRAFLRGIITK